VDGGSGSHFDTAILPVRLACEGQGVALGRWSLVERHIRDGRLVAPFSMSMPIDEAFYLTWATEESLAPQAATVRDWLIRHADAA
jgi:LysR family glycine cleavage system transcriptional activator